MKHEIGGKPSFTYITFTLEQGETLVAEPDAMSSMDTKIDYEVKLNGGFFKGLFRKVFGRESLFINSFTNTTKEPLNITITQATPGDIIPVQLKNNGIYIQPGAFVCRTSGISVELHWAGFRSWLAREGLFRLYAKGTGELWIGAYGHIYKKEIDGEYLIDTSHLVAYPKKMQMNLQMSGGLISSLTSGEGLVTRMTGKGSIYLQSRSLDGLASFLNPRI